MKVVALATAALSLIAHPEWTTVPDAAAVGRAYPPRARAEGRDGEARLRCTAAANGTLADCTALDDAPADYGFGAAAVALAPDLRLARAQAPGLVSFRLRLHEEGAETAGYPVSLLLRYRGPWPPPDPTGATWCSVRVRTTTASASRMAVGFARCRGRRHPSAAARA